MIGLEFDYPVKELPEQATLRATCIYGSFGNECHSTASALTLSKEQADSFIGKLKNILS